MPDSDDAKNLARKWLAPAEQRLVGAKRFFLHSPLIGQFNPRVFAMRKRCFYSPIRRPRGHTEKRSVLNRHLRYCSPLWYLTDKLQMLNPQRQCRSYSPENRETTKNIGRLCYYFGL